MKTLKYTNANKSIDVEYLVDLIGDSDMLTVYQVCQYVDGVKRVGLTNEAIAFGMIDATDQRVYMDRHNKLQHEKLTLTIAKELAELANLTLQVLEDGKSTVTLNTLDALAIKTEALDAGVAGHAHEETVTFPATADANQGDYVLLSNALTGESLAAWLDIDDAGTEPTGELYLASDHQVVVPIAVGNSAIQVAAAFVAALDEHEWADGVTITDGLDGTVAVNQDYTGEINPATPKNTDDSSDGSISAANDVLGTAGTLYEEKLAAEGGNEPYTWSTDSTLPVGLFLNSDGTLEGIPAETGTFPVVVTVTDQFGVKADSEELSLVVTNE